MVPAVTCTIPGTNGDIVTYIICDQVWWSKIAA